MSFPTRTFNSSRRYSAAEGSGWAAMKLFMRLACCSHPAHAA